MKKIFRIIVLFASVFFFMNEPKAQTRQTYNNGNYYYYPEIDAWYDIPNRRFIYFENERWIFSRELSNKYRDYDVNNGYKVLIDDTRPYVNAGRYRELYKNYYTAYHKRQNRLVVYAGTRDRSNERGPAYDENGRIAPGRIQDRQPPGVVRTSQQSVPRNYEPSETRQSAERRPIENTALAEKTNTEKNRQVEMEEPEIIEETEPIIERKPFEPGKIQPAEKTDRSVIETGSKEVRAKEENRARIEPITKEPVVSEKTVEPAKKETIAPVKAPEPVKKEPVKTEPAKPDTVPVMNRNRVPIAPGGSREAQYSEKYKKQVGIL